MGNVQHRLNIVLGVDAAGMGPGIQEALAKNKQFAAETQRLNQQMAEARAKIRQAKASGASDETMAALKADLDRARESRAAATSEFRLKTQLDETYFRATHTQQEVMLRERQMYYAKLREMHAANAQMLAKIDRTAAAETARIMAGGGDGGGAGGRNFMGVNLARRGPVMHSIREAGRMAGMSGVGGEAGYMGMMLMDLGLVGGGIAAGVMAMAETYKAATEAAKALADAQREHRDLVRDAAHWMEQYTRAATTAAGDVFQKRDEDLRKKQEALDEKWKAFQEESGGVWRTLASLFSDADLKTAGEIGGMQGMVASQLRGNAERLEQEQRIADLRKSGDMAMAEQAATIQAMVNGPEKDRLELIQRQSQALIEMGRRHADRLTLFANDPSKSKWDREDEAKRLQQETASQVRIFQTERLAQQRRFNEETHSEEVRARQAELMLLPESYNRELTMLREKHAEELRAYEQQGRDKTQLLRRQAAEEQELSQRRDRPIEQQIKAGQIELDLLKGRITEMEAMRRRLAMSNPLASPEKIAELARLQANIDEARKKAQEDRREERREDREDRHPMKVGEFSTRFTLGQVDLRAVNMDSPINTVAAETRNNGQKLTTIADILARLELRGGLN